MAIDPQEFARLLGAKIAGEVSDVGGGPFGMARLARLMHQTLTPSQGERPGRPTNPNWTTRCKVPVSAATLEKLTQLAENMSMPERKVSPMQVAALLLEEAVNQMGGKAKGARVDEPARDSNDPVSDHGQVQAIGEVQGEEYQG
jgi:hypothetical protein